MTETAHIVLALCFPGVTCRLLFKNCCIFCFAFFEFIRNVFSNTCLLFGI